MNFIGIGLIPDGGAHFFLEKRLGETKAKQIIWDGRMMGAEEALKLGLIQEVAEDGIQESLDARLTDWLSRPVQAMIKDEKNNGRKEPPTIAKNIRIRKIRSAKNAGNL